ncbi:hypothetical protein GCM10010272_52360 [Streptomyces lateritius]|nr:hypothetical protein GCM10010272_52360 [Streptomyces lateritius]
MAVPGQSAAGKAVSRWGMRAVKAGTAAAAEDAAAEAEAVAAGAAAGAAACAVPVPFRAAGVRAAPNAVRRMGVIGNPSSRRLATR